jgi:hypothetical protein
MASPRILVGAVVLVALTVACTRLEDTSGTEPMAPPDTLTPPTTSTTESRTTTTVDIDRASIYPVDPITLEPIDGYQPMPGGDWAWGVSSENGSWLGLTVGQDNFDTEMRLIDVENWAVDTTWAPSMDGPVHVTNDGTIYFISGEQSSFNLSRFDRGESSPVVIADFPDHFLWYELHIGDGRAMIFGMFSPNDDYRGEAALLTVDLVTGVVTEIPLPNVEVGTIEERDVGEEFPWTIDVYPAVVWDDARSRVLIVNVDHDVVTEIDPASATVLEHTFQGQFLEVEPPTDEVFTHGNRSAVIAGSDAALYVASALQTYEILDLGWTTSFAPLGIEAIDTESWDVVDRLEEPISSLSVSREADRLLAYGQRYSDGVESAESESSGLYVIDPEQLNVLAHHGADDPIRYYGGLSFTSAANVGYAQSWDDQSNLDVIDLETGAILNTRSAPEILFFGEAGVLVEVQNAP